MNGHCTLMLVFCMFSGSVLFFCFPMLHVDSCRLHRSPCASKPYTLKQMQHAATWRTASKSRHARWTMIQSGLSLRNDLAVVLPINRNTAVVRHSGRTLSTSSQKPQSLNSVSPEPSTPTLHTLSPPSRRTGATTAQTLRRALLRDLSRVSPRPLSPRPTFRFHNCGEKGARTNIVIVVIIASFRITYSHIVTVKVKIRL